MIDLFTDRPLPLYSAFESHDPHEPSPAQRETTAFLVDLAADLQTQLSNPQLIHDSHTLSELEDSDAFVVEEAMKPLHQLIAASGTIYRIDRDHPIAQIYGITHPTMLQAPQIDPAALSEALRPYPLLRTVWDEVCLDRYPIPGQLILDLAS